MRKKKQCENCNRKYYGSAILCKSCLVERQDRMPKKSGKYEALNRRLPGSYGSNQ